MKRLIVLALTLSACCSFAAPDPPDVWRADFQQALDHAVARRLLVGYPDLTYRPGQPATRYEGAAVLSRLVWYFDLQLPEPALLPSDVPWDHWCADACRVIWASRIAPAPKGVRFVGDAKLTRGDFALMAWNLTQALGQTEPRKRLSDVDDPRAQAARALNGMGLLAAEADGEMHPERPMPRWQICVAVRELLIWNERAGGPSLWGPVMYVPANDGGRRPG